ncbi:MULTISPECIES: hypothetical protein [Marinomonas]|uniref:Uncharacterized protein n=1 Tax=Marinomonas rhodophyticola TaxID=2992803 RepID=A0ABT3KGE9_9GAMM|nr:hypothetical protein [Marinomonas sp. KJ51-3]MCW4629624.1 hypothetical protein [Marinomonas sp. KJ51-3]
MSKHKCSLGEVQESLSKLRVQLWGTTGQLRNAGLSETDAFHQLNATGEMLDQLLKQLSRVPIPTEVFNNEGSGMAAKVRNASDDGA